MWPSSRQAARWLIWCNTLIGASAILLIAGFMLLYSAPALQHEGWRLLRMDWHPASGHYGLLPMLAGSLMVSALAMALAVPIGLLTAVYTAERLPLAWRLPVKSLLEVLVGIPSVVYGLIGVAFLGPWLAATFDLGSGRTLLLAGILLAMMVLPTLISLADDALYAVPRMHREAARGMGLYPYQVVWHAVLPLARPGLQAAVLLALGRALGETMAVMLVIGGIDRLPQPWWNVLSPGQTLTSKLGRELSEAAFASLHFSALVCMGLMLMLIVLLLTLWVLRHGKQQTVVV